MGSTIVKKKLTKNCPIHIANFRLDRAAGSGSRRNPKKCGMADGPSPKLPEPSSAKGRLKTARMCKSRRLPGRFLAPVYDLYRRHIAQFQIDAPPANWNG